MTNSYYNHQIRKKYKVAIEKKQIGGLTISEILRKMKDDIGSQEQILGENIKKTEIQATNVVNELNSIGYKQVELLQNLNNQIDNFHEKLDDINANHQKLEPSVNIISELLDKQIGGVANSQLILPTNNVNFSEWLDTNKIHIDEIKQNIQNFINGDKIKAVEIEHATSVDNINSSIIELYNKLLKLIDKTKKTIDDNINQANIESQSSQNKINELQELLAKTTNESEQKKLELELHKQEQAEKLRQIEKQKLEAEKLAEIEKNDQANKLAQLEKEKLELGMKSAEEKKAFEAKQKQVADELTLQKFLTSIKEIRTEGIYALQTLETKTNGLLNDPKTYKNYLDIYAKLKSKLDDLKTKFDDKVLPQELKNKANNEYKNFIDNINANMVVHDAIVDMFENIVPFYNSYERTKSILILPDGKNNNLEADIKYTYYVNAQKEYQEKLNSSQNILPNIRSVYEGHAYIQLDPSYPIMNTILKNIATIIDSEFDQMEKFRESIDKVGLNLRQDEALRQSKGISEADFLQKETDKAKLSLESITTSIANLENAAKTNNAELDKQKIKGNCIPTKDIKSIRENLETLQKENISVLRNMEIIEGNINNSTLDSNIKDKFKLQLANIRTGANKRTNIINTDLASLKNRNDINQISDNVETLQEFTSNDMTIITQITENFSNLNRKSDDKPENIFKWLFEPTNNHISPPMSQKLLKDEDWQNIEKLAKDLYLITKFYMRSNSVLIGSQINLEKINMTIENANKTFAEDLELYKRLDCKDDEKNDKKKEAQNVADSGYTINTYLEDLISYPYDENIITKMFEPMKNIIDNAHKEDFRKLYENKPHKIHVDKLLKYIILYCKSVKAQPGSTNNTIFNMLLDIIHNISRKTNKIITLIDAIRNKHLILKAIIIEIYYLLAMKMPKFPFIIKIKLIRQSFQCKYLTQIIIQMYGT